MFLERLCLRRCLAKPPPRHPQCKNGNGELILLGAMFISAAAAGWYASGVYMLTEGKPLVKRKSSIPEDTKRAIGKIERRFSKPPPRPPPPPLTHELITPSPPTHEIQTGNNNNNNNNASIESLLHPLTYLPDIVQWVFHGEEDWKLTLMDRIGAIAAIVHDGALGDFYASQQRQDAGDDVATATSNEERRKLLLFLYCTARDVFHPSIRLQAFRDLLGEHPYNQQTSATGETSLLPEEEWLQLEDEDQNLIPVNERLERLKQIVFQGEMESEASDQTAFERFTEAHSEWADPETSFVFFRDDERIKWKPFAYIERYQTRPTLCSMHSAVVLHYYLLSMYANDAPPSLCLSRFLRHNLRGDRLFDHVWRNAGVDSIHFLQRVLLQPRSILLKLCPRADDEDFSAFAKAIETNLLEYGPCLVSNFHVNEAFLDEDKWQHLGIPEPLCHPCLLPPQEPHNITGCHSMVLVGFRQSNSITAEGNDVETTKFLLQNWWKRKQFVEVDAEYLARSKVVLCFVVTPQTRFNTRLPHLHPQQQQPQIHCSGALDASERSKC